MKKSQIKQRLNMRQLHTNDLSQFNELLRYAFQVTDSDLLKFGWDNEEIKRSKYPILENAFVLGWFDREKLISQIALYPFQMNIYNQIYNMGGITGVATYPEYGGIGLMADLMKEILKIMRENHQSIACLYPYSIPYYRSRGFEIVSDKMTFSMLDTQVPHFPASASRAAHAKNSAQNVVKTSQVSQMSQVSVDGMMQRVEENHPDLIALHNELPTKHMAR